MDFLISSRRVIYPIHLLPPTCPFLPLYVTIPGPTPYIPIICPWVDLIGSLRYLALLRTFMSCFAALMIAHNVSFVLTPRRVTSLLKTKLLGFGLDHQGDVGSKAIKRSRPPISISVRARGALVLFLV